MHLRAIGSFGLALSLFAAVLEAQAPPVPTPGKPADVDRQVLEMRRQMTEGRTFRSHVRVTIRLKNGNRMSGIVKDGFVVERIDGIRFVAAEASEPGAGIRLHYWNGKGNFVFLPFDEIQEYRINARMTAQELTLLEREERDREVAMKQKQQAENQSAASQAAAAAQQQSPTPLVEGAQQPAQSPTLPTVPTPTSGTAPANGVSSELQTLYTLLQEYPPAAGWSQQKRDEIARRQVVVGSRPSPSEQKFVDNFADWQRACALFGAKPVTPEDNGGDDGESNTGRSRRSPRK